MADWLSARHARDPHARDPNARDPNARDPDAPDPVSKAGYEVAFEDTFDGDRLAERNWLPYHLPQWSGREAAAARYDLTGGRLRLRVDADQPPWCPEFDGPVRVSSLQTGVYAGPAGSAVGQHRFHPAAVVRQPQPALRLYTPTYGLVEMRARVTADPHSMAALWMIGYEDTPERSGEICVCEVFGRDVDAGGMAVGMGVHPFGDPRLTDDFARHRLALDPAAFHIFAAEWAPGRVSFYVDHRHVTTVPQAPDYPMQLMLGLYHFPPADGGDAGPFPKVFTVDYVRGYRPTRPYEV